MLGRPVRITEPGVPEIGLGYDRSGRLVERRCGEATLRWSYDADGLQVGRTHPDGSTLVRDRDRAGRTVALTHPVLGRVECDRDPDGRGPRRGLPPATRLGGLWRISKRDCAEVAAMLMTYDRLNTGELRGSSQADYLVSLDADFQIREGDVVLYQETAFPVVELARSLLLWLSDPRRVDFQFESMSCEEVGSVEVRQISSGWVFGSIFTPGRSSGSVEWSEVERCSLEFVSRVEDDLLGLGLDPEVVIGR